MFSLPAPWLHVNRELIDQTSVTCAPWRKGPSPMCWGYKSTTHVFSQADSVFYILPTAEAVWVTVYRAQTAVPGTYLLPRSWDVGCGVEIALLLKRKGSWSLLAQLLNICFILTFSPAVNLQLWCLWHTFFRQKTPEVTSSSFEGVKAMSRLAGVCWGDEILR